MATTEHRQGLTHVFTLESIISRTTAAFPGARLEVCQNPSPSAQHSIVVGPEHAASVALFLRDDPDLRFDYCSNVTGVDWPEKVVTEKRREVQIIDGSERVIEHSEERRVPGFLEVVYHLYSTQLRQGPLILRMRTQDRVENVVVPSLTPVWRGAEFQEREVFDLFGVCFKGHPDLRRILMWDEFTDFPMRKDYVNPDDYEYEPTPHDEVLKRSQARAAAGGLNG